jgi:hypothetical protein
MTKANAINTWQEWLLSADQLLSFDMWENIDKSLKSAQMPFESVAPLQNAGVLLAFLGGMYLASVNEPEADKALQIIRDRMLTITPETPKRKVKPSVRNTYTRYVNELAPMLSTAARLLYAAFSAYRLDDYDPHSDPNLLIREAFKTADDEQRLQATSKALISVMRGGQLWSGWYDEDDELRTNLLTIVLLVQQTFPLIPLGSVAEERLHINERLAELNPDAAEIPDDAELGEMLSGLGMQPDAAPDEMSEQEFMQDWAPLIARHSPLTDAEIEEMGERYDDYVDRTLQMFENITLGDEWDDDMVHSSMIVAHVMGVLRYRKDSSAANELFRLLTSGIDFPELVDEVYWALEQIGPVSIQMLMDNLRYTLNSEKFSLAAETLARMGRGDEEVYQFLLKRYQEASDEEEKLDLIVALGMLHDERLLPVLVQDLRDTHSDATHAATTLNALREMDAPMVIDADSGNVTITGYGEIKDVVPEWWNPEEEEDDTEDSGESDDELTDEDDGIDLDELFPDIDDAEENISVDVEDAVAPSDPAVNKTGFGPLRVEHIGRNDPCPCGSGKKFKHCHGKNA